jgi:voltage-gated potassium channel Kch
MEEDWRIEVDMLEDAHASGFLDRLRGGDNEAKDVADAVQEAFSQKVVVTRDDNVVFVYPHDEGEARRAVEVLEREMQAHGWHGSIKTMRWHPDEERWVDPGEQVPKTAEEHAAERAELVEQEREATAETKTFQFDVMITCKHHGEAKDLAKRLKAEGLAVTRRWRFVVVGVPDEDSANQLAERLRAEVPEGAELVVVSAHNLRESVEYEEELSGGGFTAVKPPEE